MKILRYTNFLIVLFLGIPLFAGTSLVLKKNDVTTWLKSDAKTFGCFLETHFSYRDKKFNCSLKNYENKGDPCKNTDEYYEGPSFPTGKEALVNKRFKAVELSWERGNLQKISITLDRKYKEKEVHKYFKLPENASIQDCSNKETCIIFLGFEHQGSGDVDCSDI